MGSVRVKNFEGPEKIGCLSVSAWLMEKKKETKGRAVLGTQDERNNKR